MIGQDCPWRHTAETPRILGVVDARALLPLLLLMFHVRWWVFYLALTSTIGFGLLSLWRITPLEGLKAVWLYVVTLGFRRAHLGHRPYRSPLGWMP